MPSAMAGTSQRMPPPGRKPAPSRSATAASTSRTVPTRAMSATPTLAGRASPAESMISNGGNKRKERDFDSELPIQETNINVVVRCRGRNDREVKENSGVVVSADGVKGRTVELSMGASALSNKTYSFDRVFSPAADQGMIFDEVVNPILNEVLSGFNCTIFAYGQTGTGKTYTMSGDITDMLPLPDDAGIIPRVLHKLFGKLENDDAESSVKCSFIELYNEELRDLLAADDVVKLKIFDDAARKSHGATLVQGVEETHIKSASKGIQLLRVGSHKRQVAATKCNDLSSRSHTVFTITTYVKQKSETGEDFVVSGKLNLVDLAGSENIQRSGAENKRAAEAGLINKSLLTLGRVINALVEKSSHIPYRESKLTRLLQDSLGGRTKTCIIATLSPAKSNLEETISTLDYAFRAKNIRNKPQSNQLISKKTLIREWTSEIEKLKSELVATRQRNGVYLTSDAYEDMTTESESRRILTEEQRDKIETMEANLRNKTQELFSLTSNLMNLKKDSETTKQALDNANEVVEKTEIVLEHTRQNLAEEEMLRKAHEESEMKLLGIGKDLVSTLGRTTADISGMHDKNRRKSDLQTINRSNWAESQQHVADVTAAVEQHLNELSGNQEQLIQRLSEKLDRFVQAELAKLTDSREFLADKTAAFEAAEREVNEQTATARDEMGGVLQGISRLREQVKTDVGAGLAEMSGAAERISAGVARELEGFHSHLHLSYSSLGKEFKTNFEDLSKQLATQRQEADVLRQQLSDAGQALMHANQANAAKIDAIVTEEREQSALDRAHLKTQIAAMIESFGETSDKRLDTKAAALRREIHTANGAFEQAQTSYGQGMERWMANDQALQDVVSQSKESIKQRVKSDWTSADEQTTSIANTTQSVHQETVRIVDAQMSQMDQQLTALDSILERVQAQNSQHHEAHVQSLGGLGAVVKDSYASIKSHLEESLARAEEFSGSMHLHADEMSGAVQPLKAAIQGPLATLRSDVMATSLAEYVPTGETPQKTSYTYSKNLPRTSPHDLLLARFRGQETIPEEESDVASEDPSLSVPVSPSKAPVFVDDEGTLQLSPAKANPGSRPTSSSLKELDLNVVTAPGEQPNAKRLVSGSRPFAKRQHTGEKDLSKSIGPGVSRSNSRHHFGVGRENLPLSASVGPGSGRVLRSRGS